MTDKKYVPRPRTVYCRELEREIAPEVWNRLAGNGSLRINIDTDVLQIYGDWDPSGPAKDDEDNRGKNAQSWVAYFVRSTINQLIDLGQLNVPDEEPTTGNRIPTDRIAAARLRVKLGELLSDPAPEWVRRLAEHQNS